MIPFVDLKAQHAEQAEELEAVALEVLRSGNYVSGARVKAFEADFATYCGSPQAITVNTGTSALHLALLSLGVSEGDEVITTPATFVATIAAILYAGATPVLADIDPVTWNIDPAALEAAITPRTRAIIPVHLHGRMADMSAIMSIADARGIPVIEDAAQAHGAELDGRRAGSFGAIGCFSFYPSKNLGACGEGGAIVTGDADIADKLRLLRDWGQTRKYEHTLPGYNFRLDELQAGLLKVKLRLLDEWTDRRRALAAIYDERLAGSAITPPAPSVGREHVYHVYAVRTPERDRLQAALQAAQIGTAIHYPVPVHLQPAYSTARYGRGAFPVSEAFAMEALSLPMFPHMTADQVHQVCDTVLKSV